MKLDGALTETGAGDEAEVAITQAGRIGQVFSAGNGGNSLADPQLRGYVQSGAAELVFVDNPISSATSQPGRPTTCSPATSSRPAPTRSAARSASSTTTPSTRSCGSASR
jgi:hypothetical protein